MCSWLVRVSVVFFFETEAKDLPHPLIKKKNTQLISGKPGENHHNR
jgi:hypothetical protein